MSATSRPTAHLFELDACTGACGLALAHAREAISLHVDSLMASSEPVPSELTPPALVAVGV
ncbi:MAG: hypothetical protein AB7L91_10700 [Dehalococcoidia bacterium]